MVRGVEVGRVAEWGGSEVEWVWEGGWVLVWPVVRLPLLVWVLASVLG